MKSIKDTLRDDREEYLTHICGNRKIPDNEVYDYIRNSFDEGVFYGATMALSVFKDGTYTEEELLDLLYEMTYPVGRGSVGEEGFNE